MKKLIFITLIASILGGCSCSINNKELFDGVISYEGENMTFSYTPPVSILPGYEFLKCIENDSIFYAEIFIGGPSEYSKSYEEKRPEMEFKFIMHGLPEKGKKYKLGSLPYTKKSDYSEVEYWNTSMPDVIGVAMIDRYPVKGLELPEWIDKNRVSKAGFLSGEITDGWVIFENIESILSEADNYPDGSSCRRHALKITYRFNAKMRMASDSTVTREIQVEGWYNLKQPQLEQKLWSFDSYSTINWLLNDFYDEDGTAI